MYYVICVCISEKNNGHCKRIIGENNGQKIGALKNRIIGKILSIIYQGLAVTAAVVTGEMIVFTLKRSNRAPSKFDLYTLLDSKLLFLHADSNNLGLELSSISERYV